MPGSEYYRDDDPVEQKWIDSQNERKAQNYQKVLCAIRDAGFADDRELEKKVRDVMYYIKGRLHDLGANYVRC